MSTRCEVVLGIDSNGRRLSTGEKLFDLDVLWGPDSIQGLVETTVDMDRQLLKKDNEILEKEIKIQNTLNTLTANVNSIMMRLDMNPMNDSKSKKSKKAKQAKPEAAESKAEDTLFQRNLMDDNFDDMKTDIAAVKGEVKSVQSQVRSVEGKVESMEDKVEHIEGKVESIEGKVESIGETMKELKEMLSQLMMRGEDVA